MVLCVFSKLSENNGMKINCPLCASDGGELIWNNKEIRVVLVDEPELPGFCRVVWNDHIAEMSQLKIDQRSRLWHVVMLVEKVILEVMQPHKMNLAALGNMVPHIHWHVIPRYPEDIFFPGSAWSEPQRESNTVHLKQQASKLPKLINRLQEVLGPSL